MCQCFPPWNPDIEIRRQLKIAHRCGQMMSPSHLSQHDDFLIWIERHPVLTAQKVEAAHTWQQEQFTVLIEGSHSPSESQDFQEYIPRGKSLGHFEVVLKVFHLRFDHGHRFRRVIARSAWPIES